MDISSFLDHGELAVVQRLTIKTRSKWIQYFSGKNICFVIYLFFFGWLCSVEINWFGFPFRDDLMILPSKVCAAFLLRNSWSCSCKYIVQKRSVCQSHAAFGEPFMDLFSHLFDRKKIPFHVGYCCWCFFFLEGERETHTHTRITRISFAYLYCKNTVFRWYLNCVRWFILNSIRSNHNQFVL